MVATESVKEAEAAAIAASAHTPQWQGRPGRHWAWVFLAVGLIITAAASLYMKSIVANNAEREFTRQCRELQAVISERIGGQARILKSGVALFDASGEVTRKEWALFTRHLDIDNELPGILGFGFSLLIPPAELNRHIQNIRAEGFPAYRVHPNGERDLYTSIIYLEPFTGRNLRAFGYDMFLEPARRIAMERARDTNSPVLSGKVTLVQETNVNVQNGTLMYMPVYRKGMPVESVEQRRAAIYGWVYNPYRMNDLMQGILGNHLEKAKQLHFQLYDGAEPSPQSLLYESVAGSSQKILPSVNLSRQVSVDAYSHRWTMCFTRTAGGFFSAEYTKVWLVMGGGVIITLLMFSLIRALQNTRAEAMKIAESLTIELRTSLYEKKQLEEVLEKSDRKYRLFVETAAEGIVVAQGGYLKFVNDIMVELTGYTKEELLSLPFLEFIHSDDRDLIMKNHLKRLKGELDTLRYEVRLLRKDKSIQWIELGGVKTEWEGQAATINFMTDTTARRMWEEQLLVAKAASEAAYKAKSDFLANMSHELRTPLNAVIGFSGTLLDQDFGPMNDKQEGFVNIILSAGKHLLSLINDILDLSKVEAGKMELDLSAFPLRELLNNSLMMLMEKAYKLGVTLHLEFEPQTDLLIVADQRKLKQIMLNLLSNAIKFTSKTGSVEVSVRRVKGQGRVKEKGSGVKENAATDCTVAPCYLPLDPGNSPLDPDGNFVEITITDSGIGIRPEDIPKLFTPFTQLNSSYTKEHAGTGLGLALTRNMVELHGGTIRVESEFGSGSRFSFSIPVMQVEEQP